MPLSQPSSAFLCSESPSNHLAIIETPVQTPRYSYVFIFGFAFASFLAFSFSFFFFLCSASFSSCFLFIEAFCSSVFSIGLKKPSSRACCAVLTFLCSFWAPFRTRSSLKPFSPTRNLMRPSTSGAFHVKLHASWSAGRTSGLKNSSRASLYGQSSGIVYFFLGSLSMDATTSSRDPCSRMSFRAVLGPTLGMGST